MQHLSRRQFLASAATGILGAAATGRFAGSVALAAGPEITRLRVESRIIEVNGKPAKVFGLVQPDGSHGIITEAGRFRVRLENLTEEPTIVHWHGLLPPYGQVVRPYLCVGPGNAAATGQM